MIAVEVTIVGCDDVTSFELEASPTDMALLQKLEKRSKNCSAFSCQPVIRVYEINEEEDE